MPCFSCREKLEEDKEFEVIGDVAELQAQASAENNTGPDTKSQGSSPVSFLFQFRCPVHFCLNNSPCLHSWQVRLACA